MTRVAVLGCGPAGLLAAHACVLNYVVPDIYSIGRRSDLPGTMYLHEPIRDLTNPEPDGTVKYVKVGTRGNYALKVYGDAYAPCSWDNFEEGEHPAWSVRAVYDLLWKLYGSQVRDQPLTAWDIDALANDYAVVFSSIPATAMCRKPYHRFNHAEIWISREKDSGVGPGEIVYNGLYGTDWYRSCDIFGYQATEYAKPVDDMLPRGIKPISTNCDCERSNVFKIGRFGKWSKGELIHHAFQRVDQVMGDIRAMH